MAEKSFVMVSLKEGKAKKLTQALSNDKCRQILDYLSTRKEATETKIAKDLNLPISTVHYNLKILAETKLVTTNEFHYSEKGKEVIHYKIANKYIIIAPNEDESFMEKLKSFIPAFITVGVVSLALYIFQLFRTGAGNALSFSKMTAPVAQKTVAEAGIVAMDAAEDEAFKTVAQVPPEVIIQTVSSTDIALWFFIGAIFAMLVFLFWQLFRKKV